MNDILSLRQATQATIHYFDVLNFAITSSETAFYLYGWSAPAETIENVLHSTASVTSQNGYFVLTGREHLIKERIAHAKTEKRLWAKVARFQWIFAICPFVRMVAICNSLAYGNVHESSDIDLFIVVKPGKLATARLLLKILTQLFGMRVHHDKVAGRFCLSFFVTEKALNLKPLANDFDPHLAYFIQQVVPLFGEDTYRKFLRENQEWTWPYFRRHLTPRLDKIRCAHVLIAFQRFFELLLKPFGTIIEKIARQVQEPGDIERRKNIHCEKAIVMIKDVYKFHENDSRQRVAEEFLTRLTSLA